MDADAYLERIGFSGPVAHDLATLAGLQRAHLTAVPFENLHVFHRIGVRTDVEWSTAKIVERSRGGWCFELNGAFAALLTAVGFEVRVLGAAVLLAGPNRIIDHATIEVQLDRPYLVDVGFGDSFIVPLALDQRGPQDGGTGTYEFLASNEGTTLAEHEDDVPAARYRFKRVARTMDEFDPASNRLQSDDALPWRQHPFATRLLDGGPDRVTLVHDRLKIRRDGVEEETPVAADAWSDVLREWFGMEAP